MKTLLILLLLVAPVSAARLLTIVWDPSEYATSYIVYVDGVAVKSVTTTEASIAIPDGKVSVTVSAANDYEESAQSDPLVIYPGLSKPKPPRVKSLVKAP